MVKSKMRLLLVIFMSFFSVFSYAIEFSYTLEADKNGVPVEVQSQTTLSNYRLGPGDVLTIAVYGEEDLVMSKVRLTDTGTITFPSVGEVSILGKRVSEVEELIASKLRGRVLKNPKVNASVDEYRPFYIAGGIKSPGGIPYQAQLTIAKAVSLAGGYTEKADKSKAYILQGNNNKLAVNQNSFVSPGDNIVIVEYDPIFINGMVTKPGSYPYQDGLTIRKAASLAGGFHERASLSKIYIIRANDLKQIPVLVSLEVHVEPGDTITVEESFF